MRNISLALAAMVLLAGCAKETLEPNDCVTTNESAEIGDGNESVNDPGTGENPEVVMTFSAEGPDVKTTVSDLSGSNRYIYWSNGDQISLNGETSVALSDVGAGARRADFEFTTQIPSPYYAVYPAAAWEDESGIVLPQTIGNGNIPMLGYSEEISGAVLKTNFAVLHFTLKKNLTDQATTIASVTVSSPTARLSGAFACDFAEGTFTPAASPTTDEKSITVTVGQSLTSSSPVDVFVPMPAGTYAFSVTITDGRGDSMLMSTGSAKTFTAGIVKNFPDITYLHWDIDTDDKLVDFASTFNAGNSGKGTWKTYPSVKLTDNISFDATSSSAFNATGGIGNPGTGDDTNYFNGVFDGNDKTISGLSATVPLFAYTGGGGVVSDFSVGSTSSFTFTHSNAAELDAGAVVGYHRGALNNVNVAADVSLAAYDGVTRVTALGGLVGREVVGSVTDCGYTGNITVPDDFIVDAQMTYVGGLVGFVSNASGTITDSDFAGTIDFAGIVASDDRTNPSMFLGGVVGFNVGTVSGCSALATNTKQITMDNDKKYTATIQNHSRKAYHQAQGGIAGQNSGMISGCNNYASIKNFILSTETKGGTASDDNSRYVCLGGVVGLNNEGATVTGSKNYAAMESRSTPRVQRIGGVAGYNKGTVSSSSNESTGSIYLTTSNISPFSLRVGEVGGVVGNNNGTVSNVQNAGNISIDRTENSSNVDLSFGGVIGVTSVAIDGGVGKQISNSGNIQDTYSGTTASNPLRFGGVVGYAQKSVQNVTNSGNVSFTLSGNYVMSRLYMGGIAGEVNGAANVTVSGCDNEGEVYFNVNDINYAHTGDYLGGILGYVSGTATAAVSDCDNSGFVHIDCTSTTATSDLCAGGIIGKIIEDGSVSGCNNVGGESHAGEVSFTYSDAAHADHYAGGIIGKAFGADLSISGCSNSASVIGGNNVARHNGASCYVGGVVAYLNGASSILNCTNTGSLQNVQNNNTDTIGSTPLTGGIVGYVEGTSASPVTIGGTTGCSVNASVDGNRGWVAGIAAYAKYVTLTKCTVTKTLNCAARAIGGIVGKAENCSISTSAFNGAKVHANNVQAGTGQGGIVGNMSDTTVDGCSCYATTLTNNTSIAAVGTIVGVSGSGNTIQNCHYKATVTTTAGSVTASIAGSGSFSGSGNVADL